MLVSSITVLCDGFVIAGDAITVSPSPPAPLPEVEGSESSSPAPLPEVEGSESSPPAPLPEVEGSASSSPAPLPVGEGGIIDVALGSITIDCQISGSGLVKTGAGTLLLGGDNSYTDSTTVSGGVLQILNATALPLGTALLVNGGVLDLGGTTTADVATLALDGGSILNGALQVDSLIQVYRGMVLADLSGQAALTSSARERSSWAARTPIKAGRAAKGRSSWHATMACLAWRRAQEP